MDLTALVVGLAGFGTILVATQARSRHRVLTLDAVGIALVATHWALLEEWAGAALNVVYLANGVAALAVDDADRPRGAYGLAYLLLLVVGLATYSTPVDAVAVFGTFVQVVAKHQSRLRVLRALVVVSGCCWLVFGIVNGSIPQTVFSVLFVAGHLHALARSSRDGPSKPAAST